VSQHAGLTEERWASFDIDQQILMIANEVHRTSRVLADEDPAARRRGYERVLRLTDLTIRTRPRAALCRELLRWRDLVAELYIADEAAADRHAGVLRTLLQLRPAAASQVALLLGGSMKPPPTSASCRSGPRPIDHG
jgi:hypothetical protein